MQALLALTVASAAMGINVGWQPLDDGGLEYIIQIEPEQLATLKSGDELAAGIRPVLSDVRRYRIVIGKGPLPHVGAPERSVLARPGVIGEPAAKVAELPTRSSIEAPFAAHEPPAAAIAPESSWSAEHQLRSAPPRFADEPGLSTRHMPGSTSLSRSAPFSTALEQAKSARAEEKRPSHGDPFAAAPPSEKPPAVGSLPAAPSYADRYRDFAPHSNSSTDFRSTWPKYGSSSSPPQNSAKIDPKPFASSTKPERLFSDPSVRPVSAEAEESRRLWGTPSPEHETRSAEKNLAVQAGPTPITGRGPENAHVEPGRPWLALTLTLFALFASLGGNVFLGWIGYDARTRYRQSIEQGRFGGAPGVAKVPQAAG